MNTGYFAALSGERSRRERKVVRRQGEVRTTREALAMETAKDLQYFGDGEATETTFFLSNRFALDDNDEDTSAYRT